MHEGPPQKLPHSPPQHEQDAHPRFQSGPQQLTLEPNCVGSEQDAAPIWGMPAYRFSNLFQYEQDVHPRFQSGPQLHALEPNCVGPEQDAASCLAATRSLSCASLSAAGGAEEARKELPISWTLLSRIAAERLFSRAVREGGCQGLTILGAWWTRAAGGCEGTLPL